jgi:DNA-binding transcriptional MerR regulator
VVEEQLTIDELAQRAGMTVRNIRAHQSRGLLPPPEVRARTGYYGAEHLERIRLIQGMQAEGFNLKSIQRLLQGPNGAGEQIMSFGQELLGSFGEERPELTTEAEIEARFGVLDPKAMRKAQRLGLLVALGDGRYEIPSPTLLRAGEELVALGIPLAHALAVAEKVERSSRSVATAFVRLFMADVVGPAPLAERSAEDWARVRAALERLRPLAAEAVRAAFQQEMGQAFEQQLQKLLDA